MARNERLNELRKQTRQRQRAANQKVSRLKQNRGVEIAGTQFDPRRDSKKIGKMNTPQLMNYLNQLNHFTSRSNDFVPDAQSRPIPGSEWRSYKRTERRTSRKARGKFSKVADKRLPRPEPEDPESPSNRGETLKEREAKMTPDHPRAFRPVNTIYQVPNRQSYNIADRKSLKKLQKDMQNRFKPEWEDKQRRAAKRQSRDMFKGIGRKDLQKRVNKLSADQFNVLWNATAFAAATAFVYHSAGSSESESQQAWYSEEIDTQLREAERLIDWAETINPNG